VPGQVEDDASILKGAGTVRTNLALLQAVRAANPGAVVIYKPHPDVLAGLRAGAIPDHQLQGLADLILTAADPAACWPRCRRSGP
jgi:capsular polysaccharide export protein